MQLHHIHEEQCPTCKAVAVEDSRPADRQHVNGQWWETRRFACGMVIEHIPNFSSNRTRHPCSRAPDQVDRMTKRIKARNATLEFVATLDCDDEFRNDLAVRVKYSNVHPG